MNNSLENIENVQKNELYKKVFIETKNILKFLQESINEFPKLFDNNFKSLEDVEQYLINTSLPNKYVCAKYIHDIPGWTCKECSKYTDSIFCHECYKKSKHLHKGHHLYFLPNSGGMCGCGEPEALFTFCPDHSGPHITQEEIDEHIAKVFKKEILDKLKLFFNKFFEKLSYYFVLTEKCDYFYPEIFKEKFENKNEENFDMINEKEYITKLKNDFCIVFQNLLNFLRLITENNLGMLYLISNYFLQNHFKTSSIDENYKTSHRCVKIGIKEIEIIQTENKNHKCECPFFTLFLLNWRDKISGNLNLLLSFTRNFPLKHTFGIIYFCFYEKIMKNNNLKLIDNRIQFILDYTTKILAEKTNIIEETYDIFYKYISEKIKILPIEDDLFEKINIQVNIIEYDSSLFSMPETKNLMKDKISLIKRIIDCLGLIHNQMKFKSIFPHPVFQERGCSDQIINLEIQLINIIESINIFTDWNKIENIKEIFKYLINKIINQASEGIQQLKNDEFSFHLGLYRCFGLLINYFCFYYSLNNKSTILYSIEYFKKLFFESQNQLENLIDIILNDYYKLFGFLSGIKNGFFNYYESMSFYLTVYVSDQRLLTTDFTLLKYLLSMTEKNLNIYDYLQNSNIEKAFPFFEKIFFLNKNDQNKSNFKKIDVYIKKDISSEELINLLNNSFNIFPPSIDYGENLELIQSLHKQYNKKIDSNFIQQYINDNLDDISILNKINLDIDDFNNIMHIKSLLNILIILMKDDSSPFFNLMRYYKKTSSTQTKRELFDYIKGNKNAMKDLDNIIREKIVQEFTCEGNLNHLNQIKKNIDDYLFNIFDEKEIKVIVEELTSSQINGNNQLFYLKDSSFKYLDMSYYYSYKDRSDAQKYIFDFKKDKIKPFNTYFFNPSELTFEFFEKAYQKILLNENNLEFIFKIIQKLFLNSKDNNIISIKNIILPVIFKYLSIFGCINTKSFIIFKIKNEDIINNITQIFYESISDQNKSINLDFEENIKEVIKNLNTFKIINNNINGDLSKLNKFDYNSEYFEKINEIINSKDLIKSNEVKKNDSKLKKLKEKYKNKMKNQNIKFLDNAKNDGNLIKEINNQDKIEENNNENETMCFFCRNKINLNSFNEPYGKGGYIFSDFFYSNSLNASIKSELKRINKENFYKEELNQKNINISKKVISCGHYFHFSCFEEKNSQFFSCPLCLKKQNILIPPLINFHDKYDFLKPYSMKALFNHNEIIEFNLFVEIINKYLSNYLDHSNDDDTFLEKFFPIFKSSFNYLENIFYYKGTNFNKLQQIEIIQNFILSIRYLTKVNIINYNELINYIIEKLSYLIIGPSEEENILNNYENMIYIEILEKILLYLSILFDYDILKELILYLIYIFLPYFSFGFYLRYLIIKNNFSNFDDKFLQNVNINNIIKYYEENNKQFLDIFKLFLQKLSLIRIITDYNHKNDDIVSKFHLNDFNDLNIMDYFSILSIYNFNCDINEIKFTNIMEKLSKNLNIAKIFEGKIGKEFDYYKILNLCIINIKIAKYENHLFKKELMIPFSPIKFEFIKLDENIFDFIEKYLEKECSICSEVSKYFYICLICGNKICHTKECNNYYLHSIKCGGKYCIFIDMEDGKISIYQGNLKEFSSIYINKEGVGPHSRRINNEFNLNREKEQLFFRNFVCYDFHFN